MQIALPFLRNRNRKNESKSRLRRLLFDSLERRDMFAADVTILGPAHVTNNTTPTIRWEASAPASTFELQVSKLDASGDSIVDEYLHVMNAVGSSFTPTTPMDLGSYRAWARDVSNGIAGNFSIPFDFEIVGDVPVPTIPAIVNLPRYTTDSTPTIEWNEVYTANRYEVWIDGFNATGTRISSKVAWSNSITTSSYTPPVDLPVGKYMVWVQAINTENEGSSFSIGKWFDIVPSILEPSKPTIDTRNAVASNQSPIVWSNSDFAENYEIWIDKYTTTGTLSQSKVVNQIGISNSSFSITSLPNDFKYRVWVRGVNSRGIQGPWSNGYDFKKVDNVAAPPTPVFTNQTATTIDKTPKFTWTDSETSSTFEIWVNQISSTGAIVTSQIISDQNLTTPTYATSNPLPLGLYRAWVRAKNGENELSAWSVPYNFEIKPGFLAAPSSLGPEKVVSPAPTFSWTAIPGATNYELWVNGITENGAWIPAREKIVHSSNIQGTSFTSSTPLPQGSYLVWVRAKDNANALLSLWSQPYTFYTPGDAQAGYSVVRNGNELVISGTNAIDSVSVNTVVGGIVVTNQSITSAIQSGITSIKFFGYAGNDTFVNNTPIVSKIYGGSGADVLKGGSGKDEVYGMEGNDELQVEVGDYIDAGAGNDTIKLTVDFGQVSNLPQVTLVPGAVTDTETVVVGIDIQSLAKMMQPLVKNMRSYATNIEEFIVNDLSKEIPVVSDLSKLANLGPYTYRRAIDKFFGTSKVQSLLEFVTNVKSLPAVLNNTSGFYILPAMQVSGTSITSQSAEQIAELANISWLTTLENSGVTFPVLRDPGTLVNVLLGKDVDLVKYKNDKSHSTNVFKESITVPTPTPISIDLRLKGDLGYTIFADMGYDTNGFRTGNLLDGVYIHEISIGITTKLTASAAALIGISIAGFGPGVSVTVAGTVKAGLTDAVDGKIRVSELTNSTPFLFVQGQIDYDAEIFLKASLKFLGEEYAQKTWPVMTLVRGSYTSSALFFGNNLLDFFT